jgi:uncharacterized protein YqeY
MSIQSRLTEDMKAAMKAGDVVTRDAVRLIRSALGNAAIEKGARDGELSDEAATDVLAKMAKQYRDSIETYRNAERDDLVAKEQAELDVVLRYMPEQLDEAAVRALVTAVIAQTGADGPAAKGKVMGALMPQVKGKADGSLVNRVVTEELAALG